MKNKSETSQNTLQNLLTRKDFLGELKLNEDIIQRRIEESQNTGGIPEVKRCYLDRDEKVLNFDEFVKRNKL